MPDNVTQQHLEILSEIAEMLSDDEFRSNLQIETDANLVHKHLTSWEPSVI
jgi:PTS system nitrogen regulatory IIA component